MAEKKDKKYYWLKLKKDFFKRHDIQIIENMPNGKDYVLFYLKLLVESVDHEGGLRFNETIPYNEQMLSTITNTNVDTVSKAMELFRSLGMVEVLDDQTIYMNEVSKLLGSETYWAEKKREQREKKKLPQTEVPRIGQCPTEVQDVQVMSKVEKEIDIEIEKEIDIEIEKELELEREEKNNVVRSTPVCSRDVLVDEIIRYLNLKANKNFRTTTKAYRKEITGRLNDKEANYQLEHFKYVIDVKCADWLGTDMEKHLNPETLFRAGNFDKYLNQPMPKQNKKTLRNLASTGQIDLSDVL